MKTAFVTGGNGEIGRAIVSEFKKHRYTVIAPGSAEMDCNDNMSIKRYCENLHVGPINAYVHAAGINHPKPFTEVTAESLLKTIQINTLSFLFISQQLNHHFDQAGARIVAISSIYGTISRTNRIEYSTAKHGLKGMVQTMALELAGRNILVNTVSPGFIATGLTYKNNSADVINELISDIPVKRLGKPEDISGLVFYLCSDKNNFVTGQDLIVDGGYLCGGFQP